MDLMCFNQGISILGRDAFFVHVTYIKKIEYIILSYFENRRIAHCSYDRIDVIEVEYD